jgi:iron complex transport system substrate-binding protein
MIGREVTIVPGSYKRVVCIGAGALRMYSYIGDVALLAGVEDIDNTTLSERPMMFDSVARPYVLAYGETFNTLPSCGVGGPMAQAAEAEKILSCNPDIVISEFEDVEKEDALQEQLGVPVITLKAGGKGVFDDAFYGSMELLGKVFGEEEKAAALNKFVQDQAAEITARTADIADENKPSVYVCGLGNWGTTDHLMTAENYVSFQIANVKNVLSGTGTQGIQPIEEEKFVSIGGDMDMIIMDAAAVKNIKPLYQEDPTMFDTCKAWQNGEVYLEMAYNAYYTNFEIALINTWFIAKTVYPEQFADIDLTAKTNEVTQMFYGMDLADEIFACPSSFGGYQKIDTATFFG